MRLRFALIGAALLAVVAAAWAEPRPPTAAVVAVDWSALRQFAAAWSLPPAVVAEILRRAGVTHAFIREAVLADFLGLSSHAGGPGEMVVPLPGGEAVARSILGVDLPAGFQAAQADRLYVLARPDEVADWLARGLSLRLGPHRVDRLGADGIAVRAPLTPDLWHLPILPMPQDVTAAHDAGLAPVIGLTARPPGSLAGLAGTGAALPGDLVGRSGWVLGWGGGVA